MLGSETELWGTRHWGRWGAIAALVVAASSALAAEAPQFTQAPDFRLADVSGKELGLADLKDARAVVVVFLGT